MPYMMVGMAGADCAGWSCVAVGGSVNGGMLMATV